MRTPGVESSVMVSGDNSLGQLWCKKEIQVAAKFTNANDFDYENKIQQITKVSAFNLSISFCFSDLLVIFRGENGKIKEFNVGNVKQICCLDDTVLVLVDDGKIFDCTAGKYFSGSGYTEMAAIPGRVVVLRNDGKVLMFASVESEAKEIADNGRVVGCTNDEIFVFTGAVLKVFLDDKIFDIETKVPIVIIASSDSESLFIDTNGVVWHYDSEVLMQVFSLPPVVYAAVGIQHFAAISFDGALYTWGFNPSGQLGIGSDRSTFDPVRVLDNIRIVACGTHHTLAIRDGCSQIPDWLDRSAISKFPPSLSLHRSHVSRAELLC